MFHPAVLCQPVLTVHCILLCVSVSVIDCASLRFLQLTPCEFALCIRILTHI